MADGDEVKADRIVEAILGDLRDRSGLDQAWDGIDGQTRAEILADWRRLVLGVLKDAGRRSPVSAVWTREGSLASAVGFTRRRERVEHAAHVAEHRASTRR